MYLTLSRFLCEILMLNFFTFPLVDIQMQIIINYTYCNSCIMCVELSNILKYMHTNITVFLRVESGLILASNKQARGPRLHAGVLSLFLHLTSLNSHFPS